MAVEIKVEHKFNIPIIYAKGYIDMNNYVEVHEIILKEIKEGHPNIILNFKQLNFLDSTTLGMLLRSLDKAKQVGGILVIVTNPLVDRVLSVTGLTHLFELYTSQEAALERLVQARAS